MLNVEDIVLSPKFTHIVYMSALCYIKQQHLSQMFVVLFDKNRAFVCIVVSYEHTMLEEWKKCFVHIYKCMFIETRKHGIYYHGG